MRNRAAALVREDELAICWTAARKPVSLEERDRARWKRNVADAGAVLRRDERMTDPLALAEIAEILLAGREKRSPSEG